MSWRWALTTVRPGFVLRQGEILPLRSNHRGLAQCVRGEARRQRAWRLIDQSDAGVRHPHDRHFIQCERRITGASLPSGCDAMSASGSMAHCPSSRAGSTRRQPPGPLAIERNKYLALPTFECGEAEIGGTGQHAVSGRTGKKI